MENMKYRYIYEYEFYRGTGAAETARRINDVYGAGVAKKARYVFGFNVFVLDILTFRTNPVDGRRPKWKMKN
ncbi:unnamed protein product [Parnassius mnemosyne]|uniref:Mos1 transposase HTH domain-containing protein n=1 Tax=Parnassius mnemosyne TaxID=213953 RepID=A0AAV1KYE9_9NEOP